MDIYTDGTFIYTVFFYCYGPHRDLHSFPTRRSSDLSVPRGGGVCAAAGGLGRRTAANINLGIRRQPQLAVGHDQRARGHTGDDAETVERALDGDRLRRGGAVVGHDEHIGALLALHHGLARNDDRVVLDAEDERDADELTGPQAAVTILETGLEQHGPGGRVDLIVDERENALDGRRGVACRHRDRGELLTSALPDRRQADRGNGEAHEDRAHLHDRDQRIVPRADEVALMEEQPSRAATDRRADRRVLEVQPGDCRRCRIGAHRGVGRVGRRLLCLVIFLRHRVRCGESLVARGFACAAYCLREIAEQRSLGLLQRGAVGTRIDLEQDLAGRDFVAFGEVHVEDRPVHLRQDVHRTDRLYGAGGLQLVGKRAALDAGDADRDFGNATAPARATPDRRGERYRRYKGSESHDIYTHIVPMASFRPGGRRFGYPAGRC